MVRGGTTTDSIFSVENNLYTKRFSLSAAGQKSHSLGGKGVLAGCAKEGKKIIKVTLFGGKGTIDDVNVGEKGGKSG